MFPPDPETNRKPFSEPIVLKSRSTITGTLLYTAKNSSNGQTMDTNVAERTDVQTLKHETEEDKTTLTFVVTKTGL